MATGRELLERGVFEETHVADIVRGAGCSVGAFYQRFPDKEAFFTVLIETAAAEIAADAKQFVAEESGSDAPIQETLANYVRYWANIFRCHQGMYQSVLKRSLHGNDSWAPLRELGPISLAPFIAMLAAKCGQTECVSFYYRASAGFQMVFGAMLNATMHRTVLLNLASEELIAWATETLRHCIFDELPQGVLEHGATPVTVELVSSMMRPRRITD